MKTKLAVIAMLMIFVGCSTTTRVFRGEDEIWTVKSKKDAMVTVREGDKELTVDNRGAPSTFDKIIDVLTLRTITKADSE